MPTIRIDDEVFKALQTRAQPLVDTPNSVLRRLLELNGASAPLSGPVTRRVTKRAPIGSSMPQREFRAPIRHALLENGGTAPSREILESVLARIGHRLTDVDRARVPSGEVRWRKKANWEAYQMQQEGLLIKNSGIWQLTDEGRTEADATH